MSYEGYTICLDGVVLDDAQKVIVIPFINAHHEGRLSNHELVMRSRKACEKAGVPIISKNEEAEIH